jgi:hypothetical protein
MRLPLALLAVPVALIAGCGGGSPEDEIRSIVEEGSRDPVTICDHITDKGLEQLGGKEKCQELGKSSDNVDPDVKVRRIDVEGDKATAKIDGKGGDQTVTFRKEDGEWRISPE